MIKSFVVLALAATVCVATSATPACAAETKDRLTYEQRAALVAKATAQIDQGMDRARETVERQLETARDHGKPTVASVDVLSAFGVQLWIRKMRDESAKYLKSAAQEAEEVYGSRHPEVALAWTDYAEVLITDVPNPPREAEETLAKALEIRLATLGPSDGETLMNELYLGEMEGLPSRTHLEEANISKAISRIEAAFSKTPECKNFKPDEPGSMLFHEARIYLQNHRKMEALAAFHRLITFANTHPDGQTPEYYANWFGSILNDAGYSTEVEKLKTE